MKERVEMTEGRSMMLDAVSVMGTETIDLLEATGRILAEDVFAQENIPPFSRSPLDGYVLKAADIKNASKEHPVTLPILEEVPAGKVATQPLKEGTAIKILTGAPIPDGADLVVKFEDTEFTDENVTFFKPGKSGDNIVPVGEDLKEGQLVLEKGSKITAPVRGILAGLGKSKLKVYKKVRIKLISTGSELIEIDAPLAPGKIRNSSVYTLASYLSMSGAEVTICPNVEDTVEAISEAVRTASLDADVIMTTGGVSVGDYDHLKTVMTQLGADILFWKMRLKPGGAFLACVYKNIPVFSLSGNPASAAISMILTCLPAVRKMSGYTQYMLPEIDGVLESDFKKKSPNGRMVPGKLSIQEGKAMIWLSGHSGNGMLHPLQGCNIIGELAPSMEGVKAGSMVHAYYIGDFI
ncbi:gephyrin-like molybdotransferase Glp [Eubacterium oxidoreducens]|uniref:Molybdopterin molybdenumtransferase n=1 Tax=Eubacterium oxidoreducens TaxID=1732 RepID=A0A1G6AP44_EUBOX|nr:gephyrin-like molybdotransferase Glp [Eubacterium oxidoreducens]SDB10214.1 molybdopterin molybdotransferase [Eubacterium oxidoreducens]